MISLQHSEDVTLAEIREQLMKKVIKTVIPERFIDENTICHLNPSGRFVIGGPQVIII